MFGACTSVSFNLELLSDFRDCSWLRLGLVVGI